MFWKYPQVLGVDLIRSELAGTRLVRIWMGSEMCVEQLCGRHDRCPYENWDE